MTSLLPRSHETNHVIVAENSGEVNVTPTTTADDVDVEKSERLNRASKKFLKACDQIKQIRKRIAELASMYSSFEKQHQQQYQLQLMQQHHQNDASSSLSATHLDDNSGQHSSISTSSTPSATNVNTTSAENSSTTINVNRFRETVRQQIENLQSIKSVYFIYANTKADEITRLQCELYGEDAVRMAYETSNAADTSPSSSSSHHNSSSSSRNSARSEASEANNHSDPQLSTNYFMDTSTSRPQNDSTPSSSSSRPGQIDFLAV